MINNEPERKLEEALDLLHSAKLSKDDNVPEIQALFLNSNPTNEYRLLQLNSELLASLESNQKLLIKGDEDDDAVICSDTATYYVTQGETSNSLLLANALKFSGDVQQVGEPSITKINVTNIFHEYLHASRGWPRLDKLRNILSTSIYSGPECDDITDSKLYTLEELKNIIQSSDAELSEALRVMDVIEIGGKIRELDFEYHFRILSYMLELVDTHFQFIDAVDYDATCDLLKGIAPLEVITGLFRKYTEESKVIEAVQLYKYKETEICRFLAKSLLSQAGKFNYKDFLQAWKDSVPDGMTPTEDMLADMAIINKNSNANIIWLFEEIKLPDDIEERFRIIFEAKSKWTAEEITPFLRRVSVNKTDVNALLIKHARGFKVDGIQYYASKHRHIY